MIPRGNDFYELINDTSAFHVDPIVLKVIDAAQIPNFNPDLPPSANELATQPAKVVNMAECRRQQGILDTLRAKTNRSASEELAFYQALVALNGIDMLFILGYYMQFLKETFGILNVSNNNSAVLSAVCSIPALDNVHIFLFVVFFLPL